MGTRQPRLLGILPANEDDVATDAQKIALQGRYSSGPVASQTLARCSSRIHRRGGNDP